MDGGRLIRRNDPGRVVGRADSTAREASERHGVSKGEGEGGVEEEQGLVRPDAPIETKEDRRRCMGVGLQ